MQDKVSMRGRKAMAQARYLRKALTNAERVLWIELRDRRLNGLKFRRQVPVANYIADFYCAEKQLVIELDGDVHELRQQSDRERDAFFSAHGLSVLRFRNDQVIFDLDLVLSVIRSSPSFEGEDR